MAEEYRNKDTLSFRLQQHLPPGGIRLWHTDSEWTVKMIKANGTLISRPLIMLPNSPWRWATFHASVVIHIEEKADPSTSTPTPF